MVIEKSKILFFRKEILAWFEDNRRDFPWRDLPLSNFELIIAEVLLQRTRAETVAKYFDDFIQKYSSWSDINNVDTDELEKDLKPLGLYKQRAKRLKLLAGKMTKTNSFLPDNRERLESLPLIGQYIANAILLLIHGGKAPLLDINMARVIERFFEQREKVDIRYDEKLKNYANQIVNHPSPIKINWAVLDFASIICTKNKPKCQICPLSEKCTYYNHEITN